MVDPRSADLVYICDWLPPNFGAVGQYAELATRERARLGERVVLIGLTSGKAGTRWERLGLGHRLTVRICAARYDKTRFARRLLWTLVTNTRLLLAAWPHLRRARGVIFTGSPPLFLHWIALANLFIQRPLTYRITDFHPECLIAERGGRCGLVLRLVLAMTWFWRRRIARFEVVARDQAERLIAGGIPSERIILARDRAPVTIRAGAHRAPRPPGTEGRSLLLYSGNWGLAHDAETVLAAYRRHHRCGTGRTLLWLNASGQRAIRLRAALREEALPFVDGALVPLDRLASLLMAADAHLVTLAPGFEGLVLPSKVYACIETRRPILFVGAARSDVHALCLERDVPHYRRVDPGDVLALEAALTAIADVRARDLSAAQEPLHRAAVRAPAPRPRTMSALASHAAADAHAAE